jgi:hypothetical protein
MIILLPTFFIILSMILEGITHAILYSGQTQNAFKGNEHVVFNLERLNWGALLISGIFLGCFEANTFGWSTTLLSKVSIDIVAIGLFSWLSLSFFHNGAYGVCLAKIEFKDKSWLSLIKHWAYSSKHDTAKFSYTFVDRLYFLLFGILLLTVAVITHSVI